MPGTTEQISFIYNGTEYDATAYADKHPGGRDFIENMKAERKDFTEYFKYILIHVGPCTLNKPKKSLNLSPLSEKDQFPMTPSSTWRS